MSYSKKVLITEEFHPIIEEGFTHLGYEVDNIWDIDTAGVKAIIHNYEILVINSKIKVDKTLLENANKLKVVARVGSGLEIIDQEECQKRKIHIISTPEGNANAVAEHTLAFILSAFNNLFKSQNEILQHEWIREGNRGVELSGKTLGIIGCGNNGSQLVNLLAGFDTEILIYDIVDISSKITNPRARQVSNMQEIYD